MEQRIKKALAERQQVSLYRQRKVVQPQGSRLLFDGKSYLNFSGNDYLDFANSDDLKQAFSRGVKLFGCGSTGSPLVNGYHPVYQELENKIAQWLGFESVLLFSTGFGANANLLKTLFEKEDLIIQDKLNHASLIDGGLASKAQSVRFNHNNMAHLEKRLKLSDHTIKAVVSEGVFSMDGDCADMLNIAKLTQHYQAQYLLDDAHGIGVMGHEGQGSWYNKADSSCKPDILMATFGKAFGLSGAFVAASKDVIDYLVQFSRSYIYSTAMPPALAYAITNAVDFIQQQAWRRDKLHENIHYFKQLMGGSELVLNDSLSAIQPVMVGAADQALLMAEHLKKQGIWATAIRPPTVPINSSRIRITLSAGHERNDIKQLVNSLISSRKQVS